ncbi:MAG: hypothetical protein WEA59_07715 [Ferruginibacter sp.]
MKHFFLILIAYAFFNINAKAQTINLVAANYHLKANIEKGQLYMSWHTAGTNMDTNFGVQASNDAVHYSTIGYLL